jgi:hypothetical protein
MAGKGTSGRDAGGVEQRMDAREAVWRGVQRCIDSVSGIKAMLLDGDTAGIVGLILSQTKALKMQVFAMDRLDNPERKPVGYIKAVCIIRPSQENMRVLKRELEKPNYEEYHLFFTNALPEHMLKDLAMADYNQVCASQFTAKRAQIRWCRACTPRATRRCIALKTCIAEESQKEERA